MGTEQMRSFLADGDTATQTQNIVGDMEKRANGVIMNFRHHLSMIKNLERFISVIDPFGMSPNYSARITINDGTSDVGATDYIQEVKSALTALSDEDSRSLAEDYWQKSDTRICQSIAKIFLGTTFGDELARLENRRLVSQGYQPLFLSLHGII